MLRLATWNVRHSTPTTQIVSTVTDLIGRKDLDVVCLQELTPLSIAPPRALVHRALAHATGWNAALAVHPRLYPGWLEAVGIFTGLPIVRGRRIRLSSNRAYVQAVVQSAALGEVCIGCIHLSSPGRRREELRSVMVKAPDRRYILAGDFNLRPDDPVLSAQVPQLTSDDLPGVDHIYLTRDLQLIEPHLDRTEASDHDAVIAAIDSRSRSR